MIGCRIFESTDSVYALHYFSHSNDRMVFIPVHEGETLEYDVSIIHPNKFRGYHYDYILNYIEYFRAIDGWGYHVQQHRDILHKIENQRRYERYTLR